MNNTEILYNALHIQNVDGLENADNKKCFVCGSDIEQGIKIKDVFSSNFTNFEACNNLKGTHVCKYCTYCLKDADLRKNNIVADKNKVYFLKKNDIENYLFNLEEYVKDEFVVAITTSFKKHNSFRCRVNADTKKFYIRQEDKEVLFEVDKMKYIYKKLNEAYLQFSKEELETGNYKMISIQEFGISKFEEFEGLFKKHRKTNYFALLIYMLNSEKRNEYVQAKLKLEKEEKARLKEIEKLEKNRLKAIEKEEKKKKASKIKGR